MADRRRPAARYEPQDRRIPLGADFSLSSEGKHMLRSIRGALDEDGVFRRSNAAAAKLAGIPEADADRVINELLSRRWLSVGRPVRRLT